jgi:hypothetical protein
VTFAREEHRATTFCPRSGSSFAPGHCGRRPLPACARETLFRNEDLVHRVPRGASAGGSDGVFGHSDSALANETLGFVLIEAVAAGCVCGRRPLGWYSGHRREGVDSVPLLDPAQNANLQWVVDRIVSQPALAALVRQRAREHAEQWSWAAATAQLRVFYGSAIAGPRHDKGVQPIWMQATKKTAISFIKLILP